MLYGQTIHFHPVFARISLVWVYCANGDLVTQLKLSNATKACLGMTTYRRSLGAAIHRNNQSRKAPFLPAHVNIIESKNLGGAYIKQRNIIIQ